MASRQFSPELTFVLECCRRCFPGEHEPTRPDRAIDWPSFVRLTRFHRLEGLVAKAIRDDEEVPDRICDEIQGAARKSVAFNLQAKSESIRLRNAFDLQGVKILFLKGLALSALAYGDPLLKTGIDIDLLIEPSDLLQASGILRELGYRLSGPRECDDASLQRWHRTWKESVWTRSAPALQIDLHTRAADQDWLIPSLTAHAPRQLVDIGDGIRLDTFADDELFAYLALHGASSAWFRLKWITDLAALLHGREAAEINRLYVRSQSLGAGRSAGQALLLCHSLYGTLEGSLFLDQFRRDAETNKLFQAALRMMQRGPAEPTERLLGTLPIHLMQFRLIPGLRHKALEVFRQTRRLRLRPRL